MVHINLLCNNFNIMCYSNLDQFRNLHMGTYRICYMLFPASFKLALMCCSCMHHLLPWVASCSFVMHHACVCIMPCSCVVCLLYCVLLLDSSSFVAIVRIRSSTLGSASPVRLLHGLVLLPSGISGKMTVTLDLITIIAMLVALFYRFAALPIICLSSHPMLPWTSNLWHLSYANPCLAMIPLCSAPLIALLAAGEDEDCSMLDYVYVGISQYLLYY